MKKYISIVMSLALFATLVVSPLAFANTDADAEQTSIESTTQAEAPQKPDKQTREARIEENKKKREVKLDVAKKERLKTRCASAQGKVKSTQSKVKGIVTSRTQRYDNLSARLNKLVEKLDANNVDTSTLKTAVASLQVSINNLKDELANFEQNTTDLSDMDCAADTEGFQATLEQSRLQLKTLKEASKAIHIQLKDSVKPVLAEIKNQLTKDESPQPQTN